MVLKLFTQPSCPKCPAAKVLARQLKDTPGVAEELSGSGGLKIEEFDVSTVNGLAEASFYTVMATPTLLLCDDKGKIVKDWRGEMPTLSEIAVHLK